MYLFSSKVWSNQTRYQLHNLLNEIRELAEQKSVSHRDFYNVRKVRKVVWELDTFPTQVDTHIHAAACMNQKHLLRYIKKTLKSDGDVPVIKVRNSLKVFWSSLLQAGTGTMTLKQVFESMNLTPYDLTIDMLDCHAVSSTYKWWWVAFVVAMSRLEELVLSRFCSH